jgi:hypothetical protein
MDELIGSLRVENEHLRSEVMYYRSLLLSDGNPQTYSLVNSLRAAVDIKQENERLRSQNSELGRLRELCDRLESENLALRREAQAKN